MTNQIQPKVPAGRIGALQEKRWGNTPEQIAKSFLRIYGGRK